MTVLAVVREAATDLGIDPLPDAVFGSASRDMVEMKVVLNEVARQIADAHEWSVLKAVHALTGDGSAEAFALPDDFDRMPKDARLWCSPSGSAGGVPLAHVLSADDWLAMEADGPAPLPGAWIAFGGQLHVRPAPADGEAVRFFYLSANVAVAAAGASKPAFTADDDSFRLSERLLRLGLVWNWKARKGHAYAEEMAGFEAALAHETGKDRGPSILTVGRRRPAGRQAYPGRL